MARPRHELSPPIARYLEAVALDTWRYFDAPRHRRPPGAAARQHPAGPGAAGRRADLADQHRDEPAGGVAAHDLGFIDARDAGRAHRGHAGHDRAPRAPQGHLLNWYDTQTLAPLVPAYISTVDSGNLAGALMCSGGGAAASAAMPRRRRRRRRAADELADRAPRWSTAMDFGFLYDRQRRLFAIGYRLQDAEGPGRLDPSYYDLLASEARLASFVAIAKGDVPQATGSTSAARSPASTARRRCCRGARRCSST